MISKPCKGCGNQIGAAFGSVSLSDAKTLIYCSKTVKLLFSFR